MSVFVSVNVRANKLRFQLKMLKELCRWWEDGSPYVLVF